MPGLKKNVAGFVDAGGQFHPIRSPQYIGSRKATPKDRRKYSKALGGDLGVETKEKALAEMYEDPWDREAREEREQRERIEKQIAGDVYGDRSERQSLMQFVRASGGIKRQFRFGGKKAFGKRSEYDKGEIDRLSFKETGRRGLTSERGGKTLDKMYQSAREAGFDVGSIDDMLAQIEDEAAGRGTTYATMGSLTYNPKTKGKAKKNPDVVSTFAGLANGVLAAMQINEHMKRTAKKKVSRKRSAVKNPVSSKQSAVSSKAPKTANRSPLTAHAKNPRKTVKVPAKGRFYLQTIAVGDDVLGVFINDRDGDGVARKFKSVAAAKAYATRRRLALENPAKAPRKVNPTFAPAWIKKLLAKVTPKKKVSSKRSAVSSKKNPTPKRVSVKATPTAAKRNGVNKLFGKTFSQLASTAKRLKKKSFNVPAFMIGDAHTWVSRNGGSISNSGGKAVLTFSKRNPVAKKTVAKKANPTPKKPTANRSRLTAHKPNPPKAPRSRLFESFQGRTTSTTKRLETSQHLGSQRLIQLGKLHEIKLVGERPFKLNPSRAVLCATQTGKLAIAGAKFAKRNPSMRSNEISQIGEIEHVVYETHKPHHGDGPNQLYIHELGEVTGKRPTLCLDREGLPIIRGGEYKVRPEGIVN